MSSLDNLEEYQDALRRIANPDIGVTTLIQAQSGAILRRRYSWGTLKPIQNDRGVDGFSDDTLSNLLDVKKELVDCIKKSLLNEAFKELGQITGGTNDEDLTLAIGIIEAHWRKEYFPADRLENQRLVALLTNAEDAPEYGIFVDCWSPSDGHISAKDSDTRLEAQFEWRSGHFWHLVGSERPNVRGMEGRTNLGKNGDDFVLRTADGQQVIRRIP